VVMSGCDEAGSCPSAGATGTFVAGQRAASLLESLRWLDSGKGPFVLRKRSSLKKAWQ
jgi:hypothetical protein